MSDTVRIEYLGKLAEIAGRSVNTLHTFSGPVDWPRMVSILEGVSPELGKAVEHESVKVAVNGEVLQDKASLVVVSGDEVAFLPPVSGG